MKIKCKRCNVKCEFDFRKFISILRKKAKCLCDECKKIVEYERAYGKRASIYNAYRCTVGRYEEGLYKWWEDNVGKYCAVQLVQGEYFTAYIEKFSRGQIEFAVWGEKRRYLIMEIDEVILISKGNPMYEMNGDLQEGYKGLCLNCGVLYGRDYIYEPGIPYEEEKRNPIEADYQDIYSHFCITLEDVLSWRDYINTVIDTDRKKSFFTEYRVFRVEAEEHVFENTKGAWVANKLTVLDEVRHREIVSYFEKNVKLRERVLSGLVAGDNKKEKIDNLWNQYKNAVINPYSCYLSEKEIIEKCVESAPGYGTELCVATRECANCFKCEWHTTCFEQYVGNQYLYLLVRYKIQLGTFDTGCNEYKKLVENNAEIELESIERMLAFRWSTDLKKWVKKEETGGIY